jgi:predicted MFS family arabinose efflux permease
VKVYGEGDEKVETLIQMKKIDKSTHSHSSTKKIRLIIALFVITANQLSGINAILYYAKQLFNKITNDDIFMTKLLMIGLAIIQIVATFIGAFSASRRGRKSILIFGLVAVAILMFLLYLSYDFLSLINQILSEAIMGGFLFLFILFFNMSLGSFCIVYCS